MSLKNDFHWLDDDDDNYNASYPVPFPWWHIAKRKFPKEQYRIEHLVPLRGFAFLAATSGSGKTWVATEMARCVSEGTPFLGVERFATRQTRVLYIDGEQPQSEIQRRGKLLGIDPKSDMIHFLSQAEFNLNDEDGMNADWLMEYVENNEIGLVIVDTFRSVAGGMKEEKAEEVRTFFNRLKPLKEKDVAVVFLDHMRKRSGFETKKPTKDKLFASQDKTASVEVLLMMTSEEGSGVIDLYQMKNRIGLEMKPVQLSLRDYEKDGVDRIALEFIKDLDDDVTKKEQAKTYIVELLEEKGLTRKEVLHACMQQVKVGEKNASEALRELTRAETISVEKLGRQNLYRLPSKESEEGSNKLFD